MRTWNFRPIASALWRNRTGAILVAFQIAIGLAVLVNAVYVVKQRVELIGRPTGMDTENMVWVASAGFARDYDYEAAWREDLATLRGMPGVKAASLFSNIPLSGGGSSSGYQARPGEVGPKETVPGNKYDVDEAAIDALGVKLIAGRPFEPQEILPPSETFEDAPQAIVTQAFAKELFPNEENFLGKTFFNGLGEPTTIVGVMEHMQGAWVGWDKLENVVLFPRVKNGPTSVYLVRTEPGQRDAVMRDIEAKLGDSNPDRLLRPQHGHLPGERDERAACDHGARHLRPRDLQRVDAHPTDRHASRRRRAPHGYRQALPGRELDGHDRGRRSRLRRRARHRLLDLRQVRAAAARPLLPGRRRARDLVDRPGRGAAACAQGIDHLPGRREPHGVTAKA
jgi:hypothetical protein